MQILVPTARAEPDPDNAAYIVGIARSLGAGLLVLHVRQAADPEEDWMATAAAFEEAAAEAVSDSEPAVEVDAMQKVAAGEDDRGEEIARSIAEVAAQSHCVLIVMRASPQAKLSDWVSGQVRAFSDVPVVVVAERREE